MRRSLGLVLAVSVVAACSGGGDDDERSTETSVEVSTTTSTATTLATTTTVPFELEVRRAAVELLEIRNDVLMNPDVSRVSEYISDTCVCLERERGFIERFVAEGTRWSVPALEPRGVQLVVDDSVSPTVGVVGRQPEGAIVDSAGVIVRPVPPSETSAYRLTLIHDQGGWRINGLEAVQLNDDAIAEVLADGLP